jgi:hypothetical protein
MIEKGVDREKAVYRCRQSRGLYTTTRTGNYNCRHQGIIKVANHMSGFV